LWIICLLIISNDRWIVSNLGKAATVSKALLTSLFDITVTITYKHEIVITTI